jgi:hypothetical protein
MKAELTAQLNRLSPTQFGKVKQIYLMTNKIKGSTVEEFVSNVPTDKMAEGIINLVKKELGD